MGLFSLLDNRIKNAKFFLKHQNPNNYVVGHLFSYNQNFERIEVIVSDLKYPEYNENKTWAYDGKVYVSVRELLKVILLGYLGWVSSDNIHNMSVLNKETDNISKYDFFERPRVTTNSINQVNNNMYIVGHLFESLHPNDNDFLIIGNCFFENFQEQEKHQFDWIYIGKIACQVDDLIISFEAKDINWLQVITKGVDCFDFLSKKDMPENILLYKNYDPMR